jgi:hypothetical protein
MYYETAHPHIYHSLKALFMNKIFIYLFSICNLCFGIAVAQPLPPGNYQQTCQNIEMFGTTLRAMCEGAPPFVITQLADATSCGAPIENIRGNLVCPTYKMIGNVIPSGPYEDSCRNIQLLGGFYLHAACANYAGNYVQSELNLGQCQDIYVLDGQVRSGAIMNINGQLSCQ